MFGMPQRVVRIKHHLSESTSIEKGMKGKTHSWRGLAALLMLLSLQLTAQKKWDASVGMGIVVPGGQLARHDYAQGGYALMGQHLALTVGRQILPKWGAAIEFNTGRMAYADGYYAQDMYEAEGDSMGYQSVTVQSDPYRTKALVLRIRRSIAIGKQMGIELHAGAGLAQANSPLRMYGIKVADNSMWYWQKTSAISRKPVYMAGAAYLLHVSETVAFRLDCDFSFTQMKFQFQTATGSYIDRLNMPVMALSAAACVKF